jgi:hypothetical protein
LAALRQWAIPQHLDRVNINVLRRAPPSAALRRRLEIFQSCGKSKQEEHSMKKLLFTLVVLVALSFFLAFPVTSPAVPPAPKPQPAVPAAAPAEHPEIREAIASLRRAREHLNHAAHDYQGHRVDAIRAIDEAINQLQICMKYD